MIRADAHNASTYTNHKCRCEVCTRANTERTRRRRAERKREGIPVSVAHGANSTYTNWACRCEPCTAAHTRARHERRSGS